jgi:hypothetical protein
VKLHVGAKETSPARGSQRKQSSTIETPINLTVSRLDSDIKTFVRVMSLKTRFQPEAEEQRKSKHAQRKSKGLVVLELLLSRCTMTFRIEVSVVVPVSTSPFVQLRYSRN